MNTRSACDSADCTKFVRTRSCAARNVATPAEEEKPSKEDACPVATITPAAAVLMRALVRQRKAGMLGAAQVEDQFDLLESALSSRISAEQKTQRGFGSSAPVVLGTEKESWSL